MSKVKKKIEYEWRVETEDDLIPVDSYREALVVYDEEMSKSSDPFAEIVLVRDVNEFDDDNSHSDRLDTAFAYVGDGILDTRFDDNSRVPMKFHREVAKEHSKK